jgi:hypothetical protein
MVARNPRLTVRITTQFFLRQVEALAGLFDGDIILGLIFAAIGAANNKRILHSPDLLDAYGTISAVPPAQYRVRISVSALARSLGFSYETTRRHVKELIARGFCEQNREGLILTDAALLSDDVVELIKKSNADVKWYITALRRGRVDIVHIG